MENVAWHGLSLHNIAVWDDKPKVSSKAMGHPNPPPSCSKNVIGSCRRQKSPLHPTT